MFASLTEIELNQWLNFRISYALKSISILRWRCGCRCGREFVRFFFFFFRCHFGFISFCVRSFYCWFWYYIQLHNFYVRVKLPFLHSIAKRNENSIKLCRKPQYFILTFDGLLICHVLQCYPGHRYRIQHIIFSIPFFSHDFPLSLSFSQSRFSFWLFTRSAINLREFNAITFAFPMYTSHFSFIIAQKWDKVNWKFKKICSCGFLYALFVLSTKLYAWLFTDLYQCWNGEWWIHLIWLSAFPVNLKCKMSFIFIHWNKHHVKQTWDVIAAALQ